MKYEPFNVTIYCKGEAEYAKLFLEEAIAIITPEEVEADIYDGKTIYRNDYECDGEFYNPFIPIMEKYTIKTGKPLDFFFRLHVTHDDKNKTTLCGYAIFENGIKIDESGIELDVNIIMSDLKYEAELDIDEAEIDEDELWADAWEQGFCEVDSSDDKFTGYQLYRWFEGKPTKIN
jgi:hypothetical protein